MDNYLKNQLKQLEGVRRSVDYLPSAIKKGGYCGVELRFPVYTPYLYKMKSAKKTF